MEPAPSATPSATRTTVAVVFAWLLLAAMNRAAVAVFAARAPTRLLAAQQMLVDTGLHLGAGVLCALAALAGQRLPRPLQPLALFSTATLLLLPLLDDVLPGLTQRAAEATGASLTTLHAFLTIGAGAFITLVVQLLQRAAAGAAGAAAAAACSVAFYAAHTAMDAGDNEGLHVVAHGLAALCLMPLAWRVAGAGKKLAVVVGAGAAAAGASAFFFCTLPAQNELLALVQSWSGNALALPLSSQGSAPVVVTEAVKRKAGPFFSSRDGLPAVPPSEPRLLPSDAAPPIVIVALIDSLRADAIDQPADVAALPTLQALKARSAEFSRARAPGSATYYSVAALSSGRYFSQQYWTPNKKRHGALWLQNDDQVHFPQLLQKAGVRTAVISGFPIFGPDLGMMRGFDTVESVKDEGRQLARSSLLNDRLFQVLHRHEQEEKEKQTQKPLFVYVHYFDLHFPYEATGTEGSPRQRYRRCLEALDQELARLLAVVDDPQRKARTLLLLSADHGEEFGEHGTKHHSRTLFEQLVHVPLLVAGPGVAPRKIATPVGLIDVGPTVLDVFGVDTPPVFMGQSLVPLLAGKSRTFQRPLIAEGRKMRSIVVEDGKRMLKVIDDRRRRVVKVFDLTADPQEKRPLPEAEAKAADEARQLLQLFFDVHQNRTPGYTPPLRL